MLEWKMDACDRVIWSSDRSFIIQNCNRKLEKCITIFNLCTSDSPIRLIDDLEISVWYRWRLQNNVACTDTNSCPSSRIFCVSLCSTPNFICSLDAGVPRLLITENDTSYKSNIYKNRMMRTSYQFKIEFITNIYLKIKGK